MSKNKPDQESQALPSGHYWEDPVYHYLSRLHRSALTDGDDAEAVRVDELMQALINRTIPEERYWELDTEAKADRKQQKEKRKKRSKPPKRVQTHGATSINVAELKKRIFNPQVSRENVIKALEAIPSTERKATIAGLPPWLRRKLGDYLK